MTCEVAAVLLEKGLAQCMLQENLHDRANARK